eukprot:PhF_6_TR27366/c0_g1_i2/m.40253
MLRRTLFFRQASTASITITATQNYFARLGVAENSTDADIKAAYRRRALVCHPDLAPDTEKEKRDAEFRLLSEAYQCLTNPTERKRYQAKLNRSTGKPAPKPAQQQQQQQPQRSSSFTVNMEEAPDAPPQQDWHRYNRYQSGFHVYYSKDKTPSSPKAQFSRNRSEYIFRRAFMGRRAEHVILDLHQALKRGAPQASSQVYGLNAQEVHDDVRRAMNKLREESKRQRNAPPKGLRVPKKPPSTHCPFHPPLNMSLPAGVTSPSLAPNMPMLDLWKTAEVEKDMAEDIRCDEVYGGSTHLWRRYREWGPDGVSAKYREDPRQWRVDNGNMAAAAQWPRGQGVLYSWHRPF